MDRISIIRKFYEEDLFNDNIPDYQKLHWESEWSQKIRFEIFLSNIKSDNYSLLDVGCGLGNLYDYTQEKGVHTHYTGVDILPGMIKQAKERHPSCDYYCNDIFKEHPFKKESFDVVYSSGIFNLNLGNNKKFLNTAIELFIHLSKKYIVFNLLHINSPSKESKFFYYEPSSVVKMIEDKHETICKIEILEHYLKNDFTIICEKC